MDQPKPYISRFTEHFDTLPPSTRVANVALSESLRLELADAQQTRDAIVKALIPVSAELCSLAQIHRDLTAVLANYHHFYTSRGLPPRQDPAKPLSPLDAQALELGDRVAYLAEHKRLLEERLRCWNCKVDALRARLRAACHMAAYAKNPLALARAENERPRTRWFRQLARSPPPVPPARSPPPPPPPPPVRSPPPPPSMAS